MSSERFKAADTGSDKNDFLSSSGRLYLRFYDITAEQLEVVTDLRDKFDQYDQLNKTQLQLDPKNEFQMRSMYLSNFQSRHPLQFILGRFSSLETGGTFTDGGGIQYKFTPNYRFGAVAGLNPMSEDTQIVDFNSKATTFAIYSAYEPKDVQASIESKNFFFNHAFVSQRYGGQEDRRYLYQNFYYQWSAYSRIMSSMYFDFVPVAHMQNWNLNWDQKSEDKQVAHLQILGVDSIQYRRRQGIRETLPSSEYQQASFQYDFPLYNRSTLAPSVTYGERSVDKLTKSEAKLKLLLNDFSNTNFDSNAYGGLRRNFASKDIFLGGGFGYYIKQFEFTTDLELSKEKYKTETLTPMVMTLNGSYIPTRDYFMSSSLEYARDEKVSKFAIFLKLTYRFGTKEITPLRDGAPKRGTL